MTNQLTLANYDPNGNMMADSGSMPGLPGQAPLSYDAENHLASVNTNTATYGYGYDARKSKDLVEFRFGWVYGVFLWGEWPAAGRVFGDCGWK